MNDKTIAKRSEMLQAAQQIDELALAASEHFNSTGKGFAQELQVAQAIVDLRVALTDDIMRPVMALMNTGLGFDTDRNPSKPVKGVAPIPYTVEAVREVFIESKLRGFHAVGNEFNIITGKFYAARNGLERKCKEVCLDFTWTVGVPKNLSGGCIAPCEASWKTAEGKDRKVVFEIPVKVNEYMGADAVVGKAERKLFKRVYAIATGRSIPDGDTEDAPAQLTQGAAAAAPSPRFLKKDAAPVTATAPASPEPPKQEPERRVQEKAPEAPVAPATPAPAAAPASQPEPGDDHTNASAYDLLADFLNSSEIKFPDFKHWLKTTGRWRDADAAEQILDVPEHIVALVLGDTKGMARLVTLYGTKEGGAK